MSKGVLSKLVKYATEDKKLELDEKEKLELQNEYNKLISQSDFISKLQKAYHNGGDTQIEKLMDSFL